MLKMNLILFSLFYVLLPLNVWGTTYTVINTNDNSNPGSLRWAINQANSNSGDDTIDFSLGGTATITLSSALPALTDSVTIEGPGADQLAVDGVDTYRSGFTIATGGLTVNISGLTLQNGQTSESGGAISNSSTSTVSVTDCTLVGNESTVDSSIYGGGGIFNDGGTLTVERCTFSANQGVRGGGIFSVGASATLTVFNSTFYGNEATSYGGGIYVRSGTAYITNSTVSGNTCTGTRTGGIHNHAGTIYLKNSIVAGNTAPEAPDCYNTITSQDYNLVGDNSGCTIANAGHDQIGTSDSPIDPLLGALGNYGGTTETLPLCNATDSRAAGQPCEGVAAGDSDAIDAIPSDSGQCGGSAPYNIDQRGIDRPYNSACDIGAYERTGSTLVELTSFTAEGFQDRIVLVWETASEIDNAGFHVWRRTGSQGEYIPITNVLIPAEGGPAWGAAYTHEDTDVAPGKRYYYKLEDIDASGASTFHGPVTAWPGLVNIEVNGADGPATFPAAGAGSVKVSVRPEEGMTDPHEWWLCCESPFGWFSYVYGKGWLPGIQPAWVNPQIPIDNLEVLNGPLPPGDYRFHFALDSRVDGRAPAAMFSQQLHPVDQLLLKGPSSTSHGLQPLNRWQTAVPNWLDSVEVQVE